MKRNLFGGCLISALFALTVQGCTIEDLPSGNENAESTESSFSYFPNLSNTLTAKMDAAAGLQGTTSIKYPFCIHTVGVARNATTENNVLQWATKAMNTWLAPLQGQPGWRVKQAEVLRVSPNSSNVCPSNHNGLKVYEILIRNMDGADNSSGGMLMRMGGWGIHDTVVLHEMGHGLGLGDTYKTTHGEPIGAPAANMNNHWNLDGKLTQDDINGIRFVWKRIRGEPSACPPGYVRGQIRVDGKLQNTGPWNETHCVPGTGGDTGGGDTCVDKNANCSSWASRGECTKNPNYMLPNCCKSCKNTGGGQTCVDKNANCSSWASRGECTKNPGYMLPNCCKSCS